MHTTTDETYIPFDDEPFDVDPRILSADLDHALERARTLLDRLTADATDRVIVTAYGRLYTRLGMLRHEAEMVGRIHRDDL